MKRTLLTVIVAIAMFASSVAAQPFYKSPEFWLHLTTSVASSIVATKEAHDCRVRTGISFCSGGYGPFAARESVRMAAAVGMPLLGAWGKSLGIREAYAPAIGLTGYNAYDAYDQTRKGCPAGQYPVYGTKYNCQADGGWSKPDLSHVALVHRGR